MSLPVICRLSEDERITIAYLPGEKEHVAGVRVSVEASAHVFARDGQVERVDVCVGPTARPID
jgi:hypothetical protein